MADYIAAKGKASPVRARRVVLSNAAVFLNVLQVGAAFSLLSYGDFELPLNILLIFLMILGFRQLARELFYVSPSLRLLRETGELLYSRSPNGEWNPQLALGSVKFDALVRLRTIGRAQLEKYSDDVTFVRMQVLKSSKSSDEPYALEPLHSCKGIDSCSNLQYHRIKPLSDKSSS